jgi:hypothetical protein
MQDPGVRYEGTREAVKQILRIELDGGGTPCEYFWKQFPKNFNVSLTGHHVSQRESTPVHRAMVFDNLRSRELLSALSVPFLFIIQSIVPLQN